MPRPIFYRQDPAQRCIDISDGKAEFYSGGYSFYVVERQSALRKSSEKYEKDQARSSSFTRAAAADAPLGVHGNDKLCTSAPFTEKRIAKLEQTAKPTEAKSFHAAFSSSDFYGDEVLTMDVSKASAIRSFLVRALSLPAASA